MDRVIKDSVPMHTLCKAEMILRKLNWRLKEQGVATDGLLLRSNSGTPHLWIDRNNKNISVCYFAKDKILKVWTGCGTSENKYQGHVKLYPQMVGKVKELLSQ